MVSIFIWDLLIAILSYRFERFASTLVFGQYIQPTFTVKYFSESDLTIFVKLLREAMFPKYL